MLHKIQEVSTKRHMLLVRVAPHLSGLHFTLSPHALHVHHLSPEGRTHIVWSGVGVSVVQIADPPSCSALSHFYLGIYKIGGKYNKPTVPVYRLPTVYKSRFQELVSGS